MTVQVEPAMQRNIDAFVGQLDELLVQYPGKYVVFAHEHLVNVFETMEAALKVGLAEFASEAFLVQKVEPVRKRLDFHAACRA